NPEGMVDRLVMVDSADGFARGTMEGVDLATGSDGVARVVMNGDWETKDYPKRGVWTSEEVVAAFGFTELIPSWNVSTPGETGVGAVGLGVPVRAQGDSAKALAGQICSPTSTSMVMQYWGVDRPTVENALAIYDSDTDIFGNWGRAVARAGELGLDAWIMR